MYATKEGIMRKICLNKLDDQYELILDMVGSTEPS